MKELSSLGGGKTKKTTVKPSLKTAGTTNKGSRDLRPLFAFLAAFALYLISMIVFQKYPLGDDSVLISDLDAQYAPFLALMKNKFQDLASVPSGHLVSYLTYSFKLGLGKNFASTLGYYLASPFNLLYLLLDMSQINAAVMLIIVFKLSFSSAFMCLFLKTRLNEKKSLWPVLFGVLYAFSLYSQMFMFHIMWLDGYMLLPLILYFTEKFIKKHNYLGLVISLLVLFVSNYYTAYMAGIACFLYLCVRMFEESVPLKKAVGICARYIITAAFTAVSVAAILVPVGIDTINNADKTISARSDTLVTFTPMTFVHMLLQGEAQEFGDLLPCNYPFLFIALLVVMLMMLYFISPVFKGRERRIHVACVLGAVLSTAIYPLDKAWQVFDDPNWFWHRQAFVFLPLFLTLSIKPIIRIKEIVKKDIAKVALIMYALVFINTAIGGFRTQLNLGLFNALFVTAYTALLMGYSVENWPDQIRDMPKMLSPLLSGIVCFEVVFAGPIMSSTTYTMAIRGGDAIEYARSLNAVSEFGAYVKQNNAENGAFRAENNMISDYGNEHYIEDGQAFFGNYNPVSFFNSSSNKELHHFLKQTGMPTNYNYFATWHPFSIPAVDTFFSVGSVSSRNELDYYRLEGEDSLETGLKFYENENVLPLAFAVDKEAMEFDYYRLEKDAVEKNYFAMQNDWYRSMFPDTFTEDFYNELDAGEATITNGFFFDEDEYKMHKDLVETTSASESGTVKTSAGSEDPLGLENLVYQQLTENLIYIYRTNSELPIVIEYEFKAPTDDEIFCSLVTGRILDGAEIYVNGVELYHLFSNTYYSLIVPVGKFEEGEDVKVSLICNNDSWHYLNIRFASYDEEAFAGQFDGIDKSKVNTDVVTDGYAKFSVNNLDEDEMVLTTIPAEDGWQLLIDGQPADYEVYQNALIAFEVPSGSHTAELEFTSPGLKKGALVSCAGIVLLAAFIVIDKNITKRKAKQN